MTMNRNEPLTIDDILDAVVLEESEPSHEALERWCSRFPEHRERLAEFFATWAIQSVRTDRPEMDEALAGRRMVSHALNLMYQRANVANENKKAIVESRLHKMVRAAGITEDQVMAECQLDESLFAKLDRHLIVFETIPQRCFEKLAEVMRCKVQDVMRAIQGPPVLLESYKSKSKPAAKQEEFLDAVSTSDLSEKIKAEWNDAVGSIES